MFTGDREDRGPEQHTRLVPGVVHSQHVHRRRDADQTLEGSCPRRGSKLQKAGGRGAQGARARLRYMYKARRRYFVGDILPSRFTLGPWQRLSGIRSGIRYLDIKGRDSIFTQDNNRGGYCNASGPLGIDLPRCQGPLETSPEEGGWFPKSRGLSRCLT